MSLLTASTLGGIMKQCDAVLSITQAVFSEHGIEFTPRMDVKPIIKSNPTVKDEITTRLMAGFKSGEIDLKGGVQAKYPTDKALKTYVSGLMNNWYNKGEELNGGIEYEAKNPGSRAGSGDDELKNMKLLYSQTEDEADKAVIHEFITQRIATLNAGKAKAKVVDFSVLPAELQAKFKK
jgi:hypothetical protein